MSKLFVKPADKLTIAGSPPSESEITILGFLQVLRRRRGIIFMGVSTCLLLGLIACILVKPRYKSLGEIEIQKTPTDGLGLQNLTNPLQDEQSDALDADITLQTQATILRSSSLALKVIEDLNLEDTRDFKPTFSPLGWMFGALTPSGTTDPSNASLESAPHRRDYAIKTFEKRLKITPKAGTRLIDIQYTSSEPKIAAAVVNNVAKSLVDHTLNSRAAATGQVSSWLSGQLAEIKKDAEQQQGKVEQLQRESGIYSLGITDAQGKEIAYSATLDRLQQSTQDLATATSNRIMKGALYKTVENGDPELISGLAGSTLASTSPAVNNSFQLIQNLRAQQATLATQIASDTSKYGSANPKLADEKASLDSINAQIASEVKRIGTRAENDFKASQSVEDKMRGIYNQERHTADNQNDKAIALLIARQEASDARTLYQTLYSHLKEAGVVEGLRSSNISVVDAGRVPSRPVPDIPIYMVLSLICGCFVGVAGALITEATSDRIETMAAIENTLNTPILAILPMTEARPRARVLEGKTSTAHSMFSFDNEDMNGSRVAVLNGPNTAYVEALRGLRASLLHSLDGSPPKTVLITSAGQQEGKSTLSLNLAALLALNGSRVLLVDADMRSAGVSRYLGVKRETADKVGQETEGLSDALLGSAEPTVITPFRQLPELSVLSAGSVPTYPAELLGSDRMQNLVKEWSSIYDHVLIDSPPILAVADAIILARLADTTLLVARHGRSTQKSLERAYITLGGIENTNIGVVVNGVKRNSGSLKEFYGYKPTSYYKEA
jgi:capsular exopolysaccharide synthesis family protein